MPIGQMGGGMGGGMAGAQQGGGLPQGPQMSAVSQILQMMRGSGQQQGGQGGGLSSLLSMLYPLLAGGGGQMTPGATQIGQQNLGMANQSPLSLLNPNYR